MRRPRGRRAAVAAVALATVVSAPLAGCSGSDGSEGGTGSAASRTPTTSPTTAYPSGAPSGTVLTDPGSTLGLAQGATVSWQPRQGLVGTLRMSVDRIERTTFKKSFVDWKVDAATRAYAPYFVRVHLTNVGTTDLGGTGVPLYGLSATGAPVEPSSFKETFKPCHPSGLPKPFRPGASVAVCLVYLVPAHGQLVGGEFRPTEDFDPIVWKGPVVDIAAKR
jgi:hypothetical protein